MLRNTLKLAAWLVLATAWALPPHVASAAVSDGAHIFSADAINQADDIDHQIRRNHGLDFNVETFPAIPAELQNDFQSQGRDQFFKSWASDRARATGTSGVYVSVCMNPSHLQAWVGNETQRKAFNLQDLDGLNKLLIGAFRDKEFDRGLTAAAQFVRERMDANLGGRRAQNIPPTAAPTYTPTYPGNTSVGTGNGIGGISIMPWICLIGGILIVFMVIRALISRPSGGGGYPPPPGYQGGGGYGGGYGPGYSSGGGGFGRGLLGGLLGGVLGVAGYAWLSGRGRGGYGSDAIPGTGAGYDPNSGSALPPVDTSGTSTGGDFGIGDSSSGPDLGGGADFGGGGGGADFGGGGGGDSGGSSSGGDF